MQAREFHLGDVLSVTTGRLMAPRGVEAVYDLLNFMTRDTLYTRQLLRAREDCVPCLLQQHPQLATVAPETFTHENVADVLEALCVEHGEMLLVTPLPQHVHEHIDPVREQAERGPSCQTVTKKLPRAGHSED